MWVALRVGIHAKSILRLRISFAILRLSGTLTSSNSFLQPFHNAGARFLRLLRLLPRFCHLLLFYSQFGERADAMVTCPAPAQAEEPRRQPSSESMPTVRAVADETSTRECESLVKPSPTIHPVSLP